MDGVLEQPLVGLGDGGVGVGFLVVELHVGRLEKHRLAVGHLALEVDMDALVRLDADRQAVALERVRSRTAYPQPRLLRFRVFPVYFRSHHRSPLLLPAAMGS